MTYDLVYDCKIRGILRRKDVALVQKKGQTYRISDAKSATTLRNEYEDKENP